MVVENRPGANGAVAAEFVKNAPPDGYTFMVGSIGTFAINAALYPKLPYDPLKDLDPLTLAVTTPNVLVAYPKFPANTVRELIEYAKKNPGRVTCASSGTGSSEGAGRDQHRARRSVVGRADGDRAGVAGLRRHLVAGVHGAARAGCCTGTLSAVFSTCASRCLPSRVSRSMYT